MMIQNVLTAAGRLYTFLTSLIVAVILGVATWVGWTFYLDSLRQEDFVKQGQLISLRVSQARQAQRSWQDIFSNTTYLTVNYRAKAYTTRFVMDSTFVGEGDRVSLLYHPGYDAFRQPGNEVHFDRSTRKSRLINWSSIWAFTNQNRLLLLCLVLSTAFFFVISGVLVTIISIPFLTDIARFLFVVELALAAVFFSYDLWAYFTYYQQLKTKGQEVSVRVEETRRTSLGRSSRTHFYTYQATVRHKQRERIIPISEQDYDALKPGDTLTAVYAESLDDLMSVDYGPDYAHALLPAFFGLLTFLFIQPYFKGKNHKRPPGVTT